MAAGASQDFASAALVALVLRFVAGTDPGLLPQGMTVPDPMRTATLPASRKRAILSHIYDRRGAGPFLSIGRHLETDAAPLLSVLAQAERPEILAAKWMRLERYGHSLNRTEIRFDRERGFDCRRTSRGASPSAAENALIAGVLFGVCRLAGGRGMTLALDGRVFGPGDLASAGALADGGARFAIEWRDWVPGGTPPIVPGDPAPGPGLQTLLASDVSRDWTLAEAAGLLATSTRTLQRELTAKGLTFTTVLRRERVDAAARLLRETAVSLAEIGYCCGYADQPHFQRDFRRALNMTPGEYRRVSRS